MENGTITLRDVMIWAFEGHDNKDPSFRLKNISALLKQPHTTDDELDATIRWLENTMGGKLGGADKLVMRQVLKRKKNENVIIHCRETLEFMKDLFERGSTIPPPWRA